MPTPHGPRGGGQGGSWGQLLRSPWANPHGRGEPSWSRRARSTPSGSAVVLHKVARACSIPGVLPRALPGERALAFRGAPSPSHPRCRGKLYGAEGGQRLQPLWVLRRPRDSGAWLGISTLPKTPRLPGEMAPRARRCRGLRGVVRAANGPEPGR